MKTIFKASAMLGAVAMLSACAANYDVAGVSAMGDQGDAFASALHKRYIERAEFEIKEGDWRSVSFFNTRAEMAAMGNAPAVQMPSDRKIKADGDAINSAYNALSAALKTNAPKVAPDACALAQTWFEHWMEQAEEGHQTDHIAMMRAGYEKAIPDCAGDMAMPAPMPKAMPAALPEPFIVYFTHDSADLSSANVDLIKRAAEAAKAAKVARVVLIGHADRSGSNAYNEALSRKRVEAVSKALMDEGVMGSMMTTSFAGETSPQVATEDGMRERMNRRVEVVFER
ncbi:OmpA family protein [Magnetovibrio sp.]|uniref:OmpA family protein n=1 Tax=Magnetovibrio sp. TaxID=2024836 RepID=UPI002F94C91B